MKSNVVAIIPARYLSTRLPIKPLVDLCGKPMIQRVYERTSQASLVGRVVVATDHELIARAVKKFGGEVVMTPEHIRSGSDRVAYVARQLPDADIVVNIQGDEPLIVPRMIDEAIQPLADDANIKVGTLIKAITSSNELLNPNVVKVVLDEHGCGIYFSRSPIPYFRESVSIDQWHLHHQYFKHIGLYVYRRDFLLEFASWPESTLERIEKLEQLRILEHGHKIKATMTSYDSIPVDTAEDAEKVRQILTQQSQVYAS
ncbi:MAG: 3-deoxy-manno-octulosonate cytidylyltransferase [Ignavibacteriae bacterium]|nr:3-deoxy-manno-octulosonate cytidylyltransferase [Ignavibacteria bacterium]MBI3364203.1 3-deoxy-manno-octulosonate cytidylyltransferase [Ignavibacteriota bacterium]